jgi:hypothetical protein
MNFPLLLGLLLIFVSGVARADQPTPAAIAGFNQYIAKVEARLVQQHGSANTFLVPVDVARLNQGELVIEPLTNAPGKPFPGALLHDWRGTAFVPGATAAEFEQFLKDFNKYPREFSPQVLQTSVISQKGDHAVVRMRVRQHNGITVVMDTTYDVSFGRLDPQHGYSTSRSTKISELDSSGHPMSPEEEHGFLWRMNTYWSYAQVEDGLYIQLESVSLTRSIPTGLGWIVGPFVKSVPRNSMEFTLRSASDALRRKENAGKTHLAGRTGP